MVPKVSIRRLIVVAATVALVLLGALPARADPLLITPPTANFFKDAKGNYTLSVNITNNGKVPLSKLTLTSAVLNDQVATGLPDAIINFDPGTSATVTLIFPPEAGASGTQAVLQLKGNYVAPEGITSQPGAVSSTLRVILP